jgi:hypothetical protein
MQKFYRFWKSDVGQLEYSLVVAAVIFTVYAAANVILYALR